MERVTTSPQATTPDSDAGVRYAIDPEWYAQRGLALGTAVRLRRCPDCQKAGYPKGGSKGRRTAATSRGLEVSWQDEQQAIMACCSLKDGYITPYHPIAEAVFRQLLMNGNRPITADEIYEGIQRLWAGREYLRTLDLEVLKRILREQQTYGIRPIAAAGDAASSQKAS